MISHAPTIRAGTCKRCGDLVLVARQPGGRLEAWSSQANGGFRVIGVRAYAVPAGENGTHTPHRRVCGKEQP